MNKVFIIVFFGRQAQEYYFRFFIGQNHFDTGKIEMLQDEDIRISFTLQGEDIGVLTKEALKKADELKIIVVGLKTATGQ